MNDIRIIEDKIEEDYDLTNLGLFGLHIVHEPVEELVYIYSTEDDLYYELSQEFINKILDKELITIITEDGENINFNEDQTKIIKDIIHGWFG